MRLFAVGTVLLAGLALPGDLPQIPDIRQHRFPSFFHSRTLTNE